MWLFLRSSFLSIVDKSDQPGCLLVRARVQGDIERVFPRIKVRAGVGTDYPFRADVPRPAVAAAVAAAVEAIDYGNFKAAVPERDRHDAYLGVWGVMHRLQVQRERDARQAAIPAL